MSPEPPRVLVTGTGGPSGVAVMKALADEPVELVAADIDPYAAGLYLVPESARLLVPRGDDPRFCDVLLERCRERSVAVVVPTVDSELLPLAADRERFAQAGVRIVLASEATLRLCLDKWRLHEHCAGAVRVAHTELVDDGFDAAAVDPPVIVKPRSGSGSRGVRLVTDGRDLERLPRDGTLLVQEHLPGLEHSLDVLARGDGRVIAVVPRARLKVDSGIAVTGRTVPDPALEALGRAVAERIGLTSVANVQVKDAVDGAPALLEVNPRFPGTMSLTVASGVNMPRLCVRDALGAELPETMQPFAALAMVRYLEERFMPVDELERLEREAG